MKGGEERKKEREGRVRDRKRGSERRQKSSQTEWRGEGSGW